MRTAWKEIKNRSSSPTSFIGARSKGKSFEMARTAISDMMHLYGDKSRAIGGPAYSVLRRIA
jgi:hypothetical protein